MAGTLDNSKIIQVTQVDATGAPVSSGENPPVNSPENPLDPVTDVGGGSYIFAATGSDWVAQTLKLQYLLPDGATWADALGVIGDAELAAPGAVGVVVGEGATLKVVASASIANLVWSLS